MLVQNIAHHEVLHVVNFSVISEALVRLIDFIREYSVYIFSLVATGVKISPFAYTFTLAGAKKTISTSFSLSFKRLAKMLPFRTWVPKIQIKASFKLQKMGAVVVKE